MIFLFEMIRTDSRGREPMAKTAVKKAPARKAKKPAARKAAKPAARKAAKPAARKAKPAAKKRKAA